MTALLDESAPDLEEGVIENLSPARSYESRIVAPALAIAATFALAWRLLATLLGLGGNTPTGDDVWPIRLFLHPAATGEFDWGTLLDVAYNNGQQQAVSFLIYHASAVLTDLDYFSFAWYAVALGLIRVFLTYNLVVRAAGTAPGRGLLLPLIALLTFSFSQIALYEFDVTAVPFGTGMTMLVVGAWAAVRFPNRWLGVVIGGMACTVGCYAGGVGPVALPFVLFAFIAAGTRRWRHITVLMLMAAFNIASYVWFYAKASGAALQDRASKVYDTTLVWDLVGLAFGPPGVPATRRAGVVGTVLVLLVVGSVLVALWRRWMRLEAAVPAIVFLGFGTASILQLYLLRGFAVQYYAYASMHLWIGMLCAAYAIHATWWRRRADRVIRPSRPSSVAVAALALLAATLVVTSVALGVGANRTVEDKTLFSQWKTTVSEACVRHYRIAPTTCEKDLVPWAVARLPEFVPSLAEPLEEAELGPFAKDQRWTLQGEWILDRVTVRERAGNVAWVRARRNAPESFRTARRMNLFMQAGDEVTWRLVIPEGTDGELVTAVSAATSTVPVDGADGLDLYVDVTGPGLTPASVANRQVLPRQVDWQEIHVDLGRYAGGTIDVTFGATSRAHEGSDEFVLRWPHVDIEVPDPGMAFADERLELPKATAQDLVLPVNQPDAWTLEEIDVIAERGRTLYEATPGSSPRMVLTAPVDVCLGHYSHVIFDLAVDPPWHAHPDDLVYQDHALRLYLKPVGERTFSDAYSVLVPFTFTTFDPTAGTTAAKTFGERPGGTEELPMHRYWFPLRALDLPPDMRFDAVAIAPYQRSMRDARNRFRFGEFRLAAAPLASDACAPAGGQ